MNIIDNFIQLHDIKPGYAIKAKARYGVPIFDHWLIYLGRMPFVDRNGTRIQHIFAVNMPPQEQFAGEEQILELLEKYYPVAVQPCYQGYSCDPDRVAQNAIEKIRWNPEQYNFLLHNCQDFIKQTTTGKKGSYQREEIVFWGKVVGGTALLALGFWGIDQIVNKSKGKRK